MLTVAASAAGGAPARIPLVSSPGKGYWRYVVGTLTVHRRPDLTADERYSAIIAASARYCNGRAKRAAEPFTFKQCL